ncbi:HD-GYP domain-containing protein [Clostridium aestuarii]|uniref:HD-GYP domain-containing protein n=1 Tax=Clostridium aestuarii TaxID=338193 RepID=A0ABT4D343_9CLOT|nr:HD-GYP domain-containing protein [Clostridium aestuarii]MCY6485659.1 HD-GYP domain-containing protein [Clostridium aestuarii]
MRISLDKTIRAISTALDLAEINSVENIEIVEKISNIDYSRHHFTHHSKRTAYIALKLSNLFNLNDQYRKSLYIASLLHDIGAVNSLKITHTSATFIKEHCINGANIVKPFPIFDDISDIILYHHENFNGSGPIGLKDSKIPLASQIIRIADLVELLYDESHPPYAQKNTIIDWINTKANTIFSKEIVDAFMKISSVEAFWFDLENVTFIDLILDKISPKINNYLDLKEFETIASVFSNIIDAKSNFTARHSRGISELAYMISKHLKYSEEKCAKMKIAGLLHDIGKLAIPSNILDKNGSLTSEEFSIIKSHVYYTSIILERIEDIPDISAWASNHHEKLNGKGYPRGLSSKDLSEESKILAVCDIYQALIEDRPYRKGLSRTKAFAILDEMSEENGICKSALKHFKNALQ